MNDLRKPRKADLVLDEDDLRRPQGSASAEETRRIADKQKELKSNLALANLVLDDDYLLRLRGSASVEETRRIVDEHLKTELAKLD
jgi:hypothetical protein